jgi:3,4-dihydroxy 2-butanone 4-phosphate synthase/GTP cyclohydrolase II
MQHMALVIGNVQDMENVPVRIYREQPLMELLARGGSEPDPLTRAVAEIKARGRSGIVIVLRSTAALERELDTKKMPARLETDGKGGERHGSALKRMQGWREVGIGAQILRDLGVRSIALMSSSERQYVGLGGFGIVISDRIVLT